MKEKTYVEDIDRSMYDFRNDDKDAYRVDEGLTPAIVEKISREKHDPAWMENFRLQSLQIYNEMEVPGLGTVHRRAGHEQYRDLCASKYPYDG